MLCRAFCPQEMKCNEERMALTLHYMSGSPYAWRVWLALEHKGIPYRLESMSYDAGDFRKPEFLALTPRRRVPVIVDDGFVLYESAAIIEYIEDKWSGGPRLFSQDIQQRAIERRMIREADQYVASGLEHLVEAILFTKPEHRSQEKIDAAWEEMTSELARWENLFKGDYLAGPLSAVDFTLYPELTLAQRIADRNPNHIKGALVGARLASWMARMRALPIVEATWPPHWR
jgi:glutathione S-transferase